jgi:hypothetical protein
VLSD